MKILCKNSCLFENKHFSFFSYPHVFGSGDWLEADEGDLHGENRSDDVEGAVGNVNAVGEATRDHQHENMEGNDVDEEHVATPRGNLPLKKKQSIQE